MTDVELDARVTVLEENSDVGTPNGKLNDKFLYICRPMYIYYIIIISYLCALRIAGYLLAH